MTKALSHNISIESVHLVKKPVERETYDDGLTWGDIGRRKSSRMRRDKGSICYHGVDQVHHLKMLLEPYVEGDVLISIQREQQHAEHLKDLSCVFDTYAVNTPLNGIASAMEKNPSSAWLVIAVDMPNIVTDAIELLIKKRTLTSVATCFESPLKGGPDLLFAIWEPRALPLLKEGLSTRRTDQSSLSPFLIV